MIEPNVWRGLKATALNQLETQNYKQADLSDALSSEGVLVADLIANRESLIDQWIPGVEVFSRRVFSQKGRGHFSELVRINEGILNDIGLMPQQYASASMHAKSAKGFHIHPPHIPAEYSAEDWFSKCYINEPANFSLRNYGLEQWDVMFFLTSICEVFLVDERVGMPRNVMRFTIHGDKYPGSENAAVVIPPGVAHAIKNIGAEDLIMTYGTSTPFNPDWEGRIVSCVEEVSLDERWETYMNKPL